MNSLKTIKKSLLTIAVLGAFNVAAETVAITNTTIYTGTDKGVMTDANVVIDGGKIVAINPASLEVDRTVDGSGRVLTAGFIASLNQLGLVEVGAVSTSRDARAKKGGISFDASLAFNPESTLVPFARKGGITHSVVSPRGGDGIFSGTSFNVDLSGDFDSVVSTESAVIAGFGAASKDSRASSLQSLKDKLKGQKDKLDKAAKKDDDKKAKEPSAEEKLLTALLNGEKPLIASASRATDILNLLAIKKEFGLNLVLAWSYDAVKVKTQIADAGVPVILNGMHNLPGNFDSLSASLETAGELEKAGVKVILANTDSHLIYNLRLDAGNAVSYGMSAQGALQAVTSNVAEVFGIEGGVVAKGQPANLVLWSGDPFEISSSALNVWIEGEEQDLTTRQDKLRDRYTSKEDKRRGYIK